MECTFVVGQRVICIDDRPRHPVDYGLPMAITEGETYTIREIAKRVDGIGVRLVEVSAQDKRFKNERYYFYDRFRPLVTTKTDISLFQKILEEASKEVKEKV